MRILSLLSLLILAACGFSPMYGNMNDNALGTEDFLSYVAIDNIPDRDGVYLRNALIDRFHRNGSPVRNAYTLRVINMDEKRRDLDITKSSNATRAQLIITATIELKDNVTGQAVLARNLQSITSYNILGSEFATRISRESSRENALDGLAQQIETHISLYFKRQKI